MLLITNYMKLALHEQLDKALEILDKKLDAACGMPADCVELELTYRRGLGRENTFVDYFVTAEVNNEGAVESGCDGQSVFIDGVKYEV
jgi:hypothetical protein